MLVFSMLRSAADWEGTEVAIVRDVKELRRKVRAAEVLQKLEPRMRED